MIPIMFALKNHPLYTWTMQELFSKTTPSPGNQLVAKHGLVELSPKLDQADQLSCPPDKWKNQYHVFARYCKQYQPDSHDIATWPNAISAAGLSLVASGSRHITTMRGVNKIIAGRSLDLVDGSVARQTGQTSNFGAATDATFDKIGMGLILTEAWRQNAIPKWAIIGMLAHNAFNAAATIQHEIRHPADTIRPTKLGKYSMFLENSSVMAYLVSNAIEHQNGKPTRSTKRLRHLGHISASLGIIGGLITATQYHKRNR